MVSSSLLPTIAHHRGSTAAGDYRLIDRGVGQRVETEGVLQMQDCRNRHKKLQKILKQLQPGYRLVAVFLVQVVTTARGQ